MSESSSIEEQENFMYIDAARRFTEREWSGSARSRISSMRWLKERVGVDSALYQRRDLEDPWSSRDRATFQDNIRRKAREEILKLLHDYCDVEDMWDVDMENPNNVAELTFLTIARDVTTQIATTYFTNLHDYLKAKESGESEIEEIREQVAASANLLLRQVDAMIEKGTEYTRPDLNVLINFDQVSRDSGFINAFTVSDIHHFEGIINGNSLGVTQNPYGGLRPIDILTYLNNSDDVELQNLESDTESEPFAVINTDGTVDVNHDQELEMKSGMEMAVEKVPESAQADLADRIVFSSRAEPVDGRDLTIETLEKNDLLPKWIVHFGGATVYLADKLYMKEGKKGNRMRLVIYVEDEERGLVTRSCYKSLSHVVWKLLPAYSHGWFNKANGEEQIVLPPELQKAVSYLCKMQKIEEGDVVFYGTTRKGGVASSFRNVMSSEGISLGEGFKNYDTHSRKKVKPDDPESFCFEDEEDKPNFSKVIDSWKEEAELHGIVTFELIESKNSRLRYLFCRDENKRAWIAGIDLKEAGMTSQGIKEEWIFGGDLCTPAYDYWEAAGDYGNWGSKVGENNQYTDMYQNYLSRIPLIKEYQASVVARAA